MNALRVLVIGSLLLTAACGGGPTVTLRYRPPAGQTLQYMMDQDMTIRVEGSSPIGSQQQEMKLHFDFTQTVKGPVANGTAVAVRITGVDVQFPQMSQQVRAAAADMIRGLEVRMVYDDRMRLQSAEMTNQKGEALEHNTQLAGGIQGGIFPLPEHPLREGQSWKGEIASPLGRVPGVDRAITVQYKIRLARIRQTSADTVARFDVEVTFPTDPIQITEGGTTGTLTMAGTLKGDMEFSIPRSALVHTGLNGTIRMTSDKPGQEGTIVLDQRLEVLLLDVGATP